MGDLGRVEENGPVFGSAPRRLNSQLGSSIAPLVDLTVYWPDGPTPAAMAMRESAAWCAHVDRVRLASYERWSRTARK